MSLQPLPQVRVNDIIKNVLAACEDIRKLNRVGYEFLYLSSGFIAHYNLFGFMDYYAKPGHLKRDILQNAQHNKWLNFRPGEQDYEYYHQKGKIYQKIVEKLRDEIAF